RPSFPPSRLSALAVWALEPVPKAQLPDPHESGLRGDAAEILIVDLVTVDAVELRRVRQVQQLEPDLARLVAGELRLLRKHQVDVPAELIARISIGTRRVAVHAGAGIRERGAREETRVRMRCRRHAILVAARGVRIADQIRALPAAEESE